MILVQLICVFLFQKMYEMLSYWCSHRNRESQHSGMKAMEAFLGQIAQMLVARADQGKKEGGAFKVGGWFYTCLVSVAMIRQKVADIVARG